MNLPVKLTATLRRPLARISGEKDFATIIRGAGAVLFIRAAGVGLAYASMVLLARWMGTFEFGLYTYAWVWASVLGTIAVVGYDTALLRFVPEYESTNDEPSLFGVLHHSGAMVVGCAVATGAVFAAVVLLAGSSLSRHYLIPLLVAAAIIPTISILGLFMGIARGFRWPVLAYTPSYILRPILLIVGVVFLLLAGFNASGTNVLLTALVACVAVAAWQIRQIAKRLRHRHDSAEPTYRTRHWISVALPMLLIGGTSMVLANTDIVMLGLFRPPEELAVYNGAIRTSNLIAIVVMAMSSLAVPTFSSVHARGNLDELRVLVRRVVAWTFWPALLVAFGLAAFGKPALWLFGEVFVEGYPYLLILSFGHIAGASAGVAHGLLVVTGHERSAATITASICVVNIALNAALIPLFGTVGAAVATAASSAMSTVWTLVVVRRRLKVDSFVVPIPFRA